MRNLLQRSPSRIVVAMRKLPKHFSPDGPAEERMPGTPKARSAADVVRVPMGAGIASTCTACGKNAHWRGHAICKRKYTTDPPKHEKIRREIWRFSGLV